MDTDGNTSDQPTPDSQPAAAIPDAAPGSDLMDAPPPGGDIFPGDRNEELAAASIALAEAKQRYDRAQLEAVRVNPPVGTPRSQQEWSAWLALIFREGPRERVVTLSDKQLASISRYAKQIKIVTPFGHLTIVPAEVLPFEPGEGDPPFDVQEIDDRHDDAARAADEERCY